MDFRTHRLAGTATGLAIAGIISPLEISTKSILTYSLLIAGSYFGSYLPDIDEPQSKIGKCFPFLSRIIKKIGGHRGFMHSLTMAVILWGILFSLQVEFFNPKYSYYLSLTVLAIIAGFLSHLFIDSLTISGVPWLWPLSSKKLSLGKLHTSNKFHQLLVRLLCLGVIGLSLYFRL